MKKYNLILLAGGEQQSLYEETGVKNKSQIPINGIPMIEWVIKAFKQCDRISQIVVAGPHEIDDLSCMADVRKRIPSGGSVLETLLGAVGYVKARLASEKLHRGYLISFGDAVFLNRDVIEEMITNIEDSDADIVLHYVERETYAKAGLSVKRTFIPIDGARYTGTTIYYVRRFRDLAGCIVPLARLRKYRKQPEKMLEILGCKGMDLSGVETRLSDELSVKLKIFVIDRPEAGMDVDKPEDLALAKEWLAKKEN